MNRGLRGAGWIGVLVVAGACGEKAAGSGYARDTGEQQAMGSAKAREEKATAATAAASAFGESDEQPGILSEGALPPGRGAGQGTAPGLGAGAPNKRRPISPPAQSGARPDEVASRPPAPAADPIPLTESVLDPNGRYATTYRPGAGHLAAFESAVALGIIPAAEREVVADLGAKYAPVFDPPKDTALALHTDLERAKMAPEGGAVHVRLSLRSTTDAAQERPPLAVVLVLDVSGSMRGELIKSAREAATQLVEKLGDRDQFSLVTFSTEAQVDVPMEGVGEHRKEIYEVISKIKEHGGTNIGEGLRLGYEQVQKDAVKKDAMKVVMLLSDGRANDGITDRKRLSNLSLTAFENGIQTSAFGLGSDYDGPLMSQIANDGAGGYYFLPDAKQIPGALDTELSKRLDPVATAVEVRVRLKNGVELLNVYGSRRLTADEASRVRKIEVAQDKQTEKRDKIKANRQDDNEGGMRFFMPAFARDDRHAILLKLRVPEGVGAKDLALVEIKYKDRVHKKNVTEELPLKVEYANSDAESVASTDPSVRRTVQGFAAGESLTKAARLIGEGDAKAAIDLLGEREGILVHAAALFGEPMFVDDAARLARLRVHAASRTGKLSDPLVLAMMMETAGGSHLH